MQQVKCVQQSIKNKAEELVIKDHLYQIKLKRGISAGKNKSYVCKCDFDPLFSEYADANKRYANLLKTDEFEVGSAIVILLPFGFVKKFSWSVLPEDIHHKMKTEVQRYKHEELISMKQYSSPATSPPTSNFR